MPVPPDSPYYLLHIFAVPHLALFLRVNPSTYPLSGIHAGLSELKDLIMLRLHSSMTSFLVLSTPKLHNCLSNFTKEQRTHVEGR